MGPGEDGACAARSPAWRAEGAPLTHKSPNRQRRGTCRAREVAAWPLRGNLADDRALLDDARARLDAEGRLSNTPACEQARRGQHPVSYGTNTPKGKRGYPWCRHLNGPEM